MTVSLSAVHVLVDDPDVALGFYRIFLSPAPTGDYCGGAASARLRKRLAASL